MTIGEDSTDVSTNRYLGKIPIVIRVCLEPEFASHRNVEKGEPLGEIESYVL